jgi:hypothetical protein
MKVRRLPRVAVIVSIVETCRRLSLAYRFETIWGSVLQGLADFPIRRVAEPSTSQPFMGEPLA